MLGQPHPTRDRLPCVIECGLCLGMLVLQCLQPAPQIHHVAPPDSLIPLREIRVRFQQWRTRWFTLHMPRFPALCHLHRRILSIHLLHQRVILYIQTDAIQFLFATDDVFVIIPLPQSTTKSTPTLFRDTVPITRRCQRFKPMNNIRQRHRRGNPPWLPIQWPRFPITRAGTGARPYNVIVHQHDYAVDVIGHNHQCININTVVTLRQFFPHRLDHPPSIVYPHLPIHNFPKQALPILGAVYGKGGFQTRPLPRP